VEPPAAGRDRCPNYRAAVLIPHGEEGSIFSTSRLFAAVYPEAVAIAGMIASPLWRQRAHGSTQEQFYREIGGRLSIPFNAPGTPGEISHWASTDSHHPPAEPPKTPPDMRWHNSPNPPSHGQSSTRRHAKSSRFFAMNRKGGNAILYHPHIRPVITRPHAPEMTDVRGALNIAQDSANEPASFRPGFRVQASPFERVRF
jgi:hypothetical protein